MATLRLSCPSEITSRAPDKPRALTECKNSLQEASASLLPTATSINSRGSAGGDGWGDRYGCLGLRGGGLRRSGGRSGIG